MSSALRASPCVPTETFTLLPCPFCGGPAVAERSCRVDYYGDWIVGCFNKGCDAQPEVIGGSSEASRNPAIAAWNRRAQQATPASDTTAGYASAAGVDHEPVAWRYRYWADADDQPWGLATDVSDLSPVRYNLQPLYAHPPQADVEALREKVARIVQGGDGWAYDGDEVQDESFAAADAILDAIGKGSET